MTSEDPLEFKDSKPYPDRLEAAKKKTGLNDALSVASGELNGQGVVIACMDFSFIGGSMGSVVGEKIAKVLTTHLKKAFHLSVSLSQVELV